jgi:uncharacterized protein (TIGR03437 family)
MFEPNPAFPAKHMKQVQKLFLCIAAFAAATLVHAQTLQAPPFNTRPARELGQASLTLNSLAPNLVEGRELWQPRSVAVDPSSGALFVSDTANNRVLAWRNTAGFTNGAPADVVVGQRDMLSTSAGGPGTPMTRGLSAPTGIALDAQGNLYVVDAGNNRILRFPAPLSGNPGDPDVIGQPDFNGNKPNHGAATAVPDGISTLLQYHNYTISADVRLTQSLAFDSAGNLYFTDTGNSRVLRFPAAGTGNVAKTADLVLGQPSMYTNTAADQNSTTVKQKNVMRYPMGVGIDPSGRIYVADDLNRVLVFSNAPPAAGASALRILGIVTVAQGQPVPQPINDTGFNGPRDVFFIGDKPAVVDTGNSRIMVFDPFDQWPAETALFSPAAKSVIGQPDFNTGKSGSTNTGLNAPFGATATGSDVYVADSYNNRVVDFPVGSQAASRVLGQRGFGYTAPNLIEGREFYIFSGSFYTIGSAYNTFTDAGSIAVDTTSNPPHLYVADTYNNRILGFRDIRSIRSGATADLVIGQPDLYSALINSPSNDPAQLNDSGLYLPSGLAVDSNGNLYVADRGNGRVLRFPKPFDQPAGIQHANLVLGQRSFTTENNDPSATNMSAPYGLAFMPEGNLLVSDAAHNRVLLFKPSGGDFTSGQAATAHFGQPDFFTTSTALGVSNRMVSPRGIASDSNGRLYVADPGNSRVLVYSNVGGAGPTDDPSPVLALTNSNQYTTLRAPIGVAIQPGTGQIWVVESLGGRVLQYPEFSQIPPLSPAYKTLAIPTVNGSLVAPLAMAFDGQGDMLMADSANRVEFYYPPLWATNAASYLPRWDAQATWNAPCCAPGSIATLWPQTSTGVFGSFATADFNSLPNPVPLPTALSGVQVLISSDNFPETAAPLYFVSPGQINFQVPKGAPSSGALDVSVVNKSTNQVMASGILSMAPAAPALLTNGFPTSTANPSTKQPAVQVAALNYEKDSSGKDLPVTCNGKAGAAQPSPACPGGVKPVKRGQVIALYLTGQGFLPGMPADGAQASGALSTPLRPSVYMGGSTYIADSAILYTGLAPILIGVWQINVIVPDTTPVGEVPVFVLFNDRTSTVQGYPYTVIQVE